MLCGWKYEIIHLSRNFQDIEQPTPIRDICFLKSRLVLVADSFLLVDISS